MSDEQDRKMIALLYEWASLNCDDPGNAPLTQDSAGWICSYIFRTESQLKAVTAENAKLKEDIEHQVRYGMTLENKAKMDRYREALEKISNTYGYSDDTFDEYRKLAKEALEHGEIKQ